ncbi:MAG: hypothetical protein ABEI74_00465 [Candidatus Pacearchaeota archaeon]
MKSAGFPDNLEYSCSKFYMKESIAKVWYEANNELGLKNTLLICKEGHMAEYIDKTEGEAFHEDVKNISEEKFSEICDAFYRAIKKEELKAMFKCLAVFTEMDNYNLGTEDMQKQLLRLKKRSHEEIYKYHGEGSKNFIIYKGEIFYLK